MANINTATPVLMDFTIFGVSEIVVLYTFLVYYIFLGMKYFQIPTSIQFQFNNV